MFTKYEKLITKIKPYYFEKHRHFHTWEHIQSGLDFIQELKDEYAFSDSQIIAWLFHDIVYIPHNNKNEFDSVKVFKSFYKNGDLKGFDVDESIVETIILDTIDHKASIDESRIILDIDMSSLVLDWDTFLKLRLKVLDEYTPYYSKINLKSGTLKFIDRLIEEKDSFFQTDIFASKYEKNLTVNLLNYKEYIEKNL